MTNLFSTQPVWVHVKGKPCLQELHWHLLEQNNAHQLGQKLMDKLHATRYDRQTKNWKFNKYVAVHVNIHNQALNLEPHGFNTMTRYVKVNAFTQNISEKARFGPVAMNVLADPRITLTELNNSTMTMTYATYSMRQVWQVILELD